MSRNLTSAMASAVSDTVVRPIILIDADFDGGAVQIWSGVGDLVWDSKTYTGAGAIMAIGEVEESVGMKATGTNITITGIPSEYLSLALTEDYQGRTLTIRVGALDDSNAVIADPQIVFRGRMDIMTINESSQDGTISLSVENRLIDFERPRVRRYTDQDQKIDHSTDKGLESVTAIQDKELVWGRA